MKKFFLTVLLIAGFAVSFAAGPGGGRQISDSCQVVAPNGDVFTYIFSQKRAVPAKSPIAKEPHVVGKTTVNKLVYSVFDFESGNGYVATLMGWADSNDYYEHITVPATVKYDGQDVPVTAINNLAFYNGWGITGLTIGSNVNAIFNSAFYGCRLPELYIPISVMMIRNFAFYRNPIEKVTFQYPSRKFPDLEMYNAAFSGMKIGALEIPARLKPNTYYQVDQGNPISFNPYLSQISLNPATGKWGAPTRAGEAADSCWFEIKNNALCVVSGPESNRCTTIVAYPPAAQGENFELSGNRMKVNGNAFSISPLRSICLKATAPASQEGVKIAAEDFAFSESMYLSSLTFDAQGEVDLGENVVRYCDDLEKITLGSGVTNYTSVDDVLYQPVEGGKALAVYPAGKTTTRFEVPGDVIRIASGAMSANTHLEEIILPQGLESIGEGAFYNCYSLKKADLPSSLEYIGDMGFMATQLEEITIPASLKTLGGDAFYNGYIDGTPTYISKVTVLAATPPVSPYGEVAGEIFNSRTLAEGKLILPDGVNHTVFTSHNAWKFTNIGFAGIEDVKSDYVSGFIIEGKTVTSTDATPVEVIGIDGTVLAKGTSVVVPCAGIYILRRAGKCAKITIP